jgi:hypothetical protein
MSRHRKVASKENGLRPFSCGFGRQPNKQKRQKPRQRFMVFWAICVHIALLASQPILQP